MVVSTQDGIHYSIAGRTRKWAAGESYAPLPDKEEDGRVTAHAVQTILASADALYALWSDLALIPRWQEHVISVTPKGAGVSSWVMGDRDDKESKRISFDSRITEAVEGKKLSWASITPQVELSGSVTFEASPAGRGTLVTLIQTSKLPGGFIGEAAVGTSKRSPKQIVIEDLRHFKQLAETGEIPTVEGQPHGPRGLTGGIKEWLYGETNPTPPGTRERP